jgi:hypothetical protein
MSLFNIKSVAQLEFAVIHTSRVTLYELQVA